MNVRLLIASACLLALTIPLYPLVQDQGITWFDPREAPFEVNGFEWIGEDGIYRRLPVHPRWEIREAVDQLANNTAGGQIRFSTDSRRIHIRVELREASGMYHMPATGQSGFDLYVGEGRELRYFRTARLHMDSIRYEAEMFESGEQLMRTFTLNFPLYNGVNSVWIGLDQGAEVKAPPGFTKEGKTVVYGTSITQGGCVGRPGMAYTNILSRALDMQFVNLGFSGNGRGEPALAHLITQIQDTRLVILDYEANAGAGIRESLGPFVEVLRQSLPGVPILIMSKIRYSTAREGSTAYQEWIALKEFQKELVESRRIAGDKHIYFLDGAGVLGETYDECTVDGVHPNDLGSMKIALALQPVIASILEEHQGSSMESITL